MSDLTKLLRPDSLDQMVGQRRLLGENGALKKLIEANAFFHAFFFGPPGTGKTTIARIIANQSGRVCFELNATSLAVEELRAIFESTKGALSKPLIFIDEAHRLSKNRQEVLLPVMERSDAMIIGASTENPFFALTGAIRSRSLLFEFLPLDRDDLQALLDRAQALEGKNLSPQTREYLIVSSGGDARAMLKLLEFGWIVAENAPLSVEALKTIRQSALNDGASEDETHYNLASALIKSLRGSDPDAAIYYLARLIRGGEDPRFIARRMVIFASEDIGLANPNAATLANACFASVAAIGMPESRIILSQTAIYLACSPKSNTAIVAIDRALEAIDGGLILDVPNHLKDAHYEGAKKLGRGISYKYPHDFGGYVKQSYTSAPVRFVDLKPIAYEKTVAEWLEKLRALDP
ncbi:MAG: replication-associated recombination protein A [Helicobacteraceae bacterium]|jgi:putative ATPase|nr:replication-associated recombination protein A [Helicobacteraceae bacterium]